MSEKKTNKVTSKLTEKEKQELYKNARTSDWYDSIWKEVGKCVFCDLNDKYIIYEENGIVLTISLYPYIDGHMMIIPRQHIKSPKDFSDTQWETVRKFTYLAKKMIRKAHGIKSMQIVYKDGINAQGTVNGHLHLHCIPFDAPDLSVWNYRKLENTPLENSNKYKKLASKIAKYSIKFHEQYDSGQRLPVVCDIAIINKDKKILFQERKDEYKFIPDILTFPGGHINDSSSSLKDELVREVKEEIGIKLDPKKINLIDSEITSINKKIISSHLQIKYKQKYTFLWNTYFISNFSSKRKIKPGDDCKEVLWLSYDEIMKSERITKEKRNRIKKIFAIINK